MGHVQGPKGIRQDLFYIVCIKIIVNKDDKIHKSEALKR